MSKESTIKIKGEPLKSFINKVGTFRGKKHSQSRQSASDIKYLDNDESVFRLEDGQFPTFGGGASETSTDLDSTKLSGGSNSGNNTYRSSTIQQPSITNIYDRMTPEQINEEFERSLLTGLNLKSDKDIEKMRILPTEHKRNLLINMRKNENEMDDKAVNMATTLKQTVRESRSLKDNLKSIYKIIKRISVCIAHKPISWLKEFNEVGGFLTIQELILECKIKYSTLYNNNNGSQYYNNNNNNSYTSTMASNFNQNNHNNLTLGNNSNYNLFIYNNNEFKDKDTDLTREIRYECLKTLKSFVNTTFGINVVLENKTTLMAIATAIDCNHSPTMNLACTILAVLTLLDHERILVAIGDASKFTGKHRFYSIVRGLIIDDDKELKISSMLLINALICHAEGVDFKMHLRSDFSRCGLIQAVDILKQKYGDNKNNVELDPLMKQIMIFENHSHDNFEEIDAQVENFESIWDDTKTCFEYVYNTIKDTPADFCLLSILHHLLLIRDDINIRYSYYRLIEDCVAKIVLFKDGRDPDFECGSKFDLDVDSIIKILNNSSVETSSLNDKLTSLDARKLENAISEKQSLEAKVQTLNTKLKCTEEALEELKQKVPNEIASEIELMLIKRLNTELLSNKTNSSSEPPPPPPPPPALPFKPGGGPPPPPPPPLPPGPFPGFGPPIPPPLPSTSSMKPGGGPPPPPPPPLPPFGAPPPPPPPFTDAKLPPPPLLATNQLPFGMKEKKKYTVDQPLKRINWNKIQTQRLKENSFWVKANEEKYAHDDVCQILIENFSTKATKTKLADNRTSEEPSNKKRGGPSKELKFIDEKLAQNILILIRSLKADPNEICRWLIECNLDKLNLDSLVQLEKFLPDDKILAQYQDLKENIDDLDSSEKFLVIISKLKGLRKRLRNLIFKIKFSDQHEEIKLDLAAGTQACLDVKNSEKFQKLLEVLLFVGNFMNSGSSNLEGTIGFDMKFLPKFYGTKANDNRRTLLHLVAQIIFEKHSNIFNFSKDFDDFIEHAARIDPTTIQKTMAEIKQNLSNLDLDIKNSKHDSTNEIFLDLMTPFLKESQLQFETIECMHIKMNEAYRDLADFYAFESNKYTICEFFSDLKTFSQQFQQCHNENVKLKETEDKIRRAEEEKSQREKEKLARKNHKEKLIQSHGEEMGDTGVMDNLLEALQSGKLLQASGGNSNSNNSPGGFGRRPARRDHNSLMSDFRRTINRQAPRNIKQQVQ